MVGRNMSLKNPVTPPVIDRETVPLVAQRLNHYATPGPKYGMLCAEMKRETLSPIDKGASMFQDKKLTVCAESSS
jgi:hypothetical protein